MEGARVIVDFYYDFASPWSYIGATQIERVAAENGGTVAWKPILLGAVFKAIGTPMVPLFTQSQARQRYQFRDFMHWADHWGIEFRFPSRFPMNTVSALRVALAAGDDCARVSLALYRAYWVEDRDIADRGVIESVVSSLGLDGKAMLERIESPEVKGKLRENTEAAVARGVFGVPTFLVGSQLVFGQDRLDFVAAALRGEPL